jgi:SepF-like predicted cell division protein (DUF552 family)
MPEEGQGQEGASNNGNGDAGRTYTAADYEKALERARRFEAQLVDREKQLEKYKDIDPERYKGVLEDYEKLRTKAVGGDPEEINRLVSEKVTETKAQLERNYGKTLTELKAEREELTKRVRNYEVQTPVLSEAPKYIRPASINLLKPLIDAYCHAEDGEIVIKDEKGEIRRSPQDPRLNLTVEEWLSEIAERYDIGVDTRKAGTMQSVGDRNGGNGGRGSLTVYKYLAMSEAERKALPAAENERLSSEALGLREQPRRQYLAKQ